MHHSIKPASDYVVSSHQFRTHWSSESLKCDLVWSIRSGSLRSLVPAHHFSSASLLSCVSREVWVLDPPEVVNSVLQYAAWGVQGQQLVRTLRFSSPSALFSIISGDHIMSCVDSQLFVSALLIKWRSREIKGFVSEPLCRSPSQQNNTFTTLVSCVCSAVCQTQIHSTHNELAFLRTIFNKMLIFFHHIFLTFF